MLGFCVSLFILRKVPKHTEINKWQKLSKALRAFGLGILASALDYAGMESAVRISKRLSIIAEIIKRLVTANKYTAPTFAYVNFLHSNEGRFEQEGKHRTSQNCQTNIPKSCMYLKNIKMNCCGWFWFVLCARTRPLIEITRLLCRYTLINRCCIQLHST